MSGTISIESSSSPMEGIETQIHDKNKKDSESLQLVESENKYEYEYESKPKSKLAANDAPETAASNATMSKKMKILLTLGFVSGFAALYGGLATLSQGLPCTTAGPSAISIANSRLHYFDESSLNGYEQCSDLQDDLQEAMEIIGNVTINSMADSFENNAGNNFNFICRGGGDQCSSLPSFNARPGDEVFAKEPNENVADGDTANSPPQNSPPQAAAGENSFETNNQVQGVDEADLIKSDGTHVFAAYADKIMVWNANDGTLLSTTIIPTHDDEGIHICSDKIESKENLAQSNDDCYHYKQPNSWWFSSPPPPIRVSSLMIHSQSQRLVVIASTQFALKLSSNLMQNRKQTRVFIYDISPQAIPNAEGLDVEIQIDELTLLARKDLDGTYQTARSIDEYAHIVTSSTLDLSSSLDQMLNPFTEEKFADMNVTEYRDAAHEILMGSPDHNGDSQGLAKSLAANLTRELIDIFSTSSSTSTPNDCSKLAKVALMLKAAQGAEQDSSSVLPSFTTNSVLKTLTLVHSLDISQPVTADAVDNTHTSIMTKPSGVFFPTQSYTSNVYASTSKLVVAGEAYVEDPKGDWEEHTILLIYNLFQDTSSPESVGDVPGSLLNQFSMDHHSDPDGGGDYLRVATTTWARWGLVDGTTWGQVEVSESQVTVLKMNGDTASLEIVGQATGIGSEERIYAVRFHGDRAYVVTFRQIDPFYTLNMTEPTDPRVVGELKIPGYSVSVGISSLMQHQLS